MPIADQEARAEYNRQYRSQSDVKARDNANARVRYQNGGKERKKIYDAARRKTPEYIAQRTAYMAARRKSRWAKVKLAELRCRAAKQGVPFDLVEADLVLPDKCPVLGVPLEIGTGKQSERSPSVDRITPALGYVKGNVVVVSNRVNSLKRDATVAELLAIARFYFSASGT
ncbi:hypothetical protein [Ensifer adhaerens]|uniref:hypothetical protein n=1 Tax=Ensifer adhaerens TaxID=106592 RepID=UPI00131A0881|nr:hypothetical protein [Ensifer adhaerens]